MRLLDPATETSRLAEAIAWEALHVSRAVDCDGVWVTIHEHPVCITEADLSKHEVEGERARQALEMGKWSALWDENRKQLEKVIGKSGIRELEVIVSSFSNGNGVYAQNQVGKWMDSGEGKRYLQWAHERLQALAGGEKYVRLYRGMQGNSWVKTVDGAVKDEHNMVAVKVNDHQRYVSWTTSRATANRYADHGKPLYTMSQTVPISHVVLSPLISTRWPTVYLGEHELVVKEPSTFVGRVGDLRVKPRAMGHAYLYVMQTWNVTFADMRKTQRAIIGWYTVGGKHIPIMDTHGDKKGPQTRKFVAPPIPTGKGRGKAGGYTATGLTNTEFGDACEKAMAKFGLENMHPGQRTGRLDIRHKLSGMAFELKGVTTDSQQYKMRMKGVEFKEKVDYARAKGLKVGSAILVVDTKGNGMAYWKPKLGYYELANKDGRVSKSWNYMGRVKVDLTKKREAVYVLLAG